MLTSLSIPKSVTLIDHNAFSECTGIKTLTLANGLKTIGVGAFYKNTSLTSVTIPDSVTELQTTAFQSCSSLKSVTIGSGVSRIPADCFSNCSSLESVKLGYNITEIGDSAFNSCSSLNSISFNSKLQTIGVSAFRYCNSLKTLSLPDSVVTIDRYAFNECTKLTSFSSGTGLVHLNANAFSGCTSLTEAVLKSAVNIGRLSFSGCTALKTVYLADNLQEIYTDAFYNCSKISNVYYGSSQDEWSYVTVGSGNTYLTNASFHWDSPAYNDVNYTSWYAEALKYCVSKGYFSGTAKNVFSSKEPLTRAQFVVVLAQLDKADLTGFDYQVFSDVPAGKWYTAAIAWAYNNGYVSGIGDGVFGKNNPITREQIVLMFYNYANTNGINTAKRTDITYFDDYSRTHEWAKDALSWGVAVGLISGTSDTTLDPRGEVTRAQACQLFYKFDQIRTSR